MKIIKHIEVLVKVDADWLNKDQTSNIDFVIGRITQNIEDQVNNAVAKEIIKNIKLPKIKLNSEEVHKMAVKIMAERIVDRNENT